VKRILINAMMLRRQNTGLGFYAKKILSYALTELVNRYEVTILCNDAEYVKSVLGYEGVEYVEICRKNAVLRELAVGRYTYANASNYDLLYSMSQHGFPFIKGITQIITVHDIMPYLYPKGRWHQYIYYKLYLPIVFRNITKIVTVSQSTKRDLKSYYGYENVVVTYCGTNFSVPSFIASDWNSNRRKQYIILGIHYPYKNLHSVIKLFVDDARFCDRELVIVGKYDNAYGQQLIKQVEQANAGNRIKFIGYISDEEKQDYIKGAYALIYPTKYEGFGLPVLEGMAHGIPVACSNTSSLPEVAGNAAAMFDPNDLEDMANKILMIDDEIYGRRLVSLGFENIKRFTWEDSAKKVLEVIEDALK